MRENETEYRCIHIYAKRYRFLSVVGSNFLDEKSKLSSQLGVGQVLNDI